MKKLFKNSQILVVSPRYRRHMLEGWTTVGRVFEVYFPEYSAQGAVFRAELEKEGYTKYEDRYYILTKALPKESRVRLNRSEISLKEALTTIKV